ncbi:acetylglutamate kinase [Clostridium homopropionicum DSM 5847]|uniref:Acetylglutamate kinase n=1 Tax=Clostridium homopropionicum DSM 5847 TaxID=1121318 RepID=A0A0L6ZAJ5_9CLOT|nr:acetylglutamate kinase [Clostridium homopropionicum]KOA19995.1 acetylglutamate kinase [Clostridium homopropionicum DSM 5847]SFG64250.1 N-acetylglutamate kinase [Clostridium homopropionicum]
MFSKDSDTNVQRADILIQALPYIQRFNGKTVVIKYGGNAMINEDLKNTVIRDIVLMNCVGIRVVIVHGGGPEINDFLNKIGKKSEFINGLRVTDEETIDVVQMVLAGKVNKDLVSLIHKNGGKAVGLCGIDAGLLKAEKMKGKDGADIGYVGNVVEVDDAIIENCLNGGYIPVISTVALGKEDGKVYNINADLAAAKISVKLNAEKFILITDVPGVLTDPKDESTLIPQLKVEDIPELIKRKVISGGMIPKIDCCIEAANGGVKRTHIIDGRVTHSLLLEIFSNEGVGTMIY